MHVPEVKREGLWIDLLSLDLVVSKQATYHYIALNLVSYS